MKTHQKKGTRGKSKGKPPVAVNSSSTSFLIFWREKVKKRKNHNNLERTCAKKRHCLEKLAFCIKEKGKN